MNEFKTIFEYTVGSIRADALSQSAIVVACVIGAVFLFVSRKQTPFVERLGIPLLLVAFGLGWFIMHMNLLSFAFSDLRSDCQVAEGVVHVSSKQPFHGHSGGDKITVGGQPFVVDYFFMTPGYKQTIERGGALREGVYARLRHVNGVILKVEVRTDATTPQRP